MRLEGLNGVVRGETEVVVASTIETGTTDEEATGLEVAGSARTVTDKPSPHPTKTTTKTTHTARPTKDGDPPLRSFIELSAPS